jgi:hypothetical protein
MAQKPQKPQPDNGVSPEFKAAVARWRERYNAKVAKDRDSKLLEALKRLRAALDNLDAPHNDLTAAAGTTPEAAERLIERAAAGLGDSVFLNWRLADQPKPEIPEPLRTRAHAAERTMWRALFDAVKIDKRVLADSIVVDVVDAYQNRGHAVFFRRLGAAVAQQGGLYRSKKIGEALLAMAGRELGYPDVETAKLIDTILHHGNAETDADNVAKLVRRHLKRLEADESAY